MKANMEEKIEDEHCTNKQAIYLSFILSFQGDNLSCSTTDWRIPRPLLYNSGSGSNSSIGTSNYERNIRCIYTAELASDQKLDSINIDIPSGENWFSSGSSTSSNSTSSSRVSKTTHFKIHCPKKSI